MKINALNIYYTIPKQAAKSPLNFCAQQHTTITNDPLFDYLNYLASSKINLVNKKHEGSGLKLGFEKDDIPDLYDLKVRRIDFLEENNCPDIPSNIKQKPQNFFIKIYGYGRNMDWARYMAESCNYAALMIKSNAKFEDVLDLISKDVSNCSFLNINSDVDFEKALNAGVLRTDEAINNCLATPFDLSGEKYGAYGKRYVEKAIKASKNTVAKEFSVKVPEQYPDFVPTKIYCVSGKSGGKLVHRSKGVKSSLRYSREIYNDIVENYLGKKLTKKDLNEINKKIATMHWLLVHSVPYLRGSDAIINVFIKSLYCALGIELSAPREGISFDLEAFCTELKDYVKEYPKLYESEPKYAL